jgi:hypothetical protein
MRDSLSIVSSQQVGSRRAVEHVGVGSEIVARKYGADVVENENAVLIFSGNCGIYISGKEFLKTKRSSGQTTRWELLVSYRTPSGSGWRLPGAFCFIRS